MAFVVRQPTTPPTPPVTRAQALQNLADAGFDWKPEYHVMCDTVGCRYRLGGYGDYGTHYYARRHATRNPLHRVLVLRDGEIIREFHHTPPELPDPTVYPPCSDRVSHSLALCHCPRPLSEPAPF